MPDTTLAVVGVLVRKDALLLTWIVAEQLGLTCSRLDKCLARLAAIGDVKLYLTEDAPTFYGDVISGEIRAGVTVIRNDKKGIYVVDADGVADTAPKDKMEDMNAGE